MNFQILTTLTEGRASDMEVWMGRDVFDFFHALWAQEEYLKERAKARKPKQQDDGTEG